jgi:hypothetical protein
MTTKIDKKIVKYSVKAGAPDADTAKTSETPLSGTPEPLVRMSPAWKRPDVLPASVYKIRKCHNTPDAAVYVTISNAALDNGEIVPVELFINSQDVKHQQWTTALTRTISAMFRQGVDCSFIADELIQTHDPKGGFLQKGVYHPSLVSQVGRIMKAHMEGLKLKTPLDSLQDYFEPEQIEKLKAADEAEDVSPYPASATLCPKCNHKSVILMDGCQTCMNCGDSKCG